VLDVFVLPSGSAGISNAILEAQASGLPVIAAAAGSNAELVADGVNGTLVRPGDVAQLAQALLVYLDAPARIAEHGSNARRQAEQRFSIPAMAGAYAEVYEKTLRRGR
jgi:glycosyltransferase involved in cell wall biosynthesis